MENTAAVSQESGQKKAPTNDNSLLLLLLAVACCCLLLIAPGCTDAHADTNTCANMGAKSTSE